MPSQSPKKAKAELAPPHLPLAREPRKIDRYERARGPARLKSDSDAVPFLGSRMLRWATATEQEETIHMSAIFVVLGVTLIILGVVADSRYRLL